MKNSAILFFLLLSSFFAMSQSSSYSGVRTGIITGGSLNMGLKKDFSLAGATPFLGATLTRHIDIGATYSFNFASSNDGVNQTDIKKDVYGPGAFVKIYPISFLFLEGQYEYNTIETKTSNSGTSISQKQIANSFLMGGGITFGRNSGNRSHFYTSVLWDLADNDNSPYKDAQNRLVPIFRAGVSISLTSGSNRRQYSSNHSATVSPSRRVVVNKWSARGRKRRW